MVSAGISEVILVLPLVVATRPWASVLTSLGYSLLIYQTGENTHAWGCGNHVRKCMESASSLRCHDATFTEHKAWAGKAGLLWECRQAGREGGEGLRVTFIQHVFRSRKDLTRSGVRIRNHGPSGPLQCQPHHRAPFADFTPSTECCHHFQ